MGKKVYSIYLKEQTGSDAVKQFKISNANYKRLGTQALLFGTDTIQKALVEFSEAGVTERGAISTRKEIVDFILDLIGYKPDIPIYSNSLLEPSFGEGQFLLAAVERLLKSYNHNDNHDQGAIDDLKDSIRGVELHNDTFKQTREKLQRLLIDYGISFSDSNILLESWLVHGDFLLSDIPLGFSYIIGNPPYVRQEMIPDILLAEYRRRFETIYDRADLYIPFFEKSLRLLAPSGSLGFICADRWMKNKYGGPLRKLVAKNYHLKYYIDMVGTEAFLTDVTTYPAITVIVNEESGPTRIAHHPPTDAAFLNSLSNELKYYNSKSSPVIEAVCITDGSEPWILDSFDQLALVRRLEQQFPTIEQAGCNIGIGVATGADKVFIRKFDELDVELDRKLRIIMTEDIQKGDIRWLGRGVINPFNEDGSLVNLRNYPKLYAYLKSHEGFLLSRHVAKQNPSNWYRTIDRINPEILQKPKLLIPDIKGTANIVYDDGKYYPHHNLYYITSDKWDLRALQAVLMSGIARLFVGIYSTKIRGGYLRFQAQYLRRIRLPYWKDIPQGIKDDLFTAARHGDTAACNMATFNLFGMSKKEKEAIGGNGG